MSGMMGLLIDATDQYAAKVGGSVDEVDKVGGTGGIFWSETARFVETKPRD